MKLRIISLFTLFIIFGCKADKPSVSGNVPRIISLSPHITEIIYALGAEENLVAVTDFCTYPESAQKREKVGGLLNPNTEKILRLQPTHLFGVPAHETLSRNLGEFGLSIQMLPNEAIGDVLSTIRSIGVSIHKEKQAEKLIQEVNTVIDSVKRIKHTGDGVTGMLLIGRETGTLRNMMVAGKGTYLDELWQIAGGINIFNDLSAAYSTINLESILYRNPQVIITFDPGQPPGVNRVTDFREWQPLQKINAVANKNIYVIGGGYALIPGPRVTRLAKDLTSIVSQVSRK